MIAALRLSIRDKHVNRGLFVVGNHSLVSLVLNTQEKGSLVRKDFGKFELELYQNVGLAEQTYLRFVLLRRLDVDFDTVINAQEQLEGLTRRHKLCKRTNE